MTIFLTGLLTCLALIVAIGAQSLFIMRQAIRRDRLVLALATCLGGDLVLIFAGTAGVGVVAERAPWLVHGLTWGGVLYLVWFAARSFRSAFARRRAEPPVPDAGPAAVSDPSGGVGIDGMGIDGARTEAAGDQGEDLLAERLDGTGLDAGGTRSALAVRLRRAEEQERADARTGAQTDARAGEQAQGTGRPERVLTPVRTVVLMALSVSVLNPHAILDTVIMLGTLANSHGADKWIFAAGAVSGSAVWFLTLGFGVRALAPLLDTPRTWRIVDLVVGVVMLAIAAQLALG